MKIQGGFLIGACITVIVGVFGLYGNLIPTRALDELGTKRVPLMETLHSLNYERTLIQSYFHDIIGSQQYFNRSKRLEGIRTSKDELLASVDAIWGNFTALPQVARNPDRYKEIFSAYESWRQNYCVIPDRYLDRLIRAADPEELAELYSGYTSAIIKAERNSYRFYAELITLINQNRQELNRAIELNEARGRNVTVIMLICATAGFAGAVILGFTVTRWVVRPLKAAFVQLKAIAEGDLTQAETSYSGNDEIAQMMRLLNQTQEGIRTLAFAIQDKANSLSGIGAELSSMMTESAESAPVMSAGAQSMKEQFLHQAAALTQMNDTMRQIVGNINALNLNIEKQSDSVSRSAEAVSAMAGNIAEVTQNLLKNEENVEHLASASEKGREGLQGVADSIKTIATESERLLEINRVIQTIANQTNLLAMNAAIEAAHAGDFGRGFAVVAGEIRKLAESSSNQAKTVSSVLKGIKTSLDGVSVSAETVLRHFADITIGVQTVSALETQIRNAMEQQDAGSRQMLETIGVSNAIASDVRRGSAEMLTGSHAIIGTGKNLETLTADLTGRVNEIAAGMDRLTAMISRIQEMSRENQHSIETLIGETSRFKL
jgi:methyl-accepting chemotaxis protein